MAKPNPAKEQVFDLLMDKIIPLIAIPHEIGDHISLDVDSDDKMMEIRSIMKNIRNKNPLMYEGVVKDACKRVALNETVYEWMEHESEAKARSDYNLVLQKMKSTITKCIFFFYFQPNYFKSWKTNKVCYKSKKRT